MKPTDNLKAEHDLILIMLNVLEQMSEKIASDGNIPSDDIRKALEFLEFFADKNHNEKEEKYLFTAMREAGIPKEPGQIEVMISEHGRGRHFIDEMKNLLAIHEKGQDGPLMVLTTPALQYVNLLRSHIWKENDVLFPMAEREMPLDRMARIEEQLERFESEETGQGKDRDFREMIEKFARLYLGRTVSF